MSGPIYNPDAKIELDATLEPAKPLVVHPKKLFGALYGFNIPSLTVDEVPVPMTLGCYTPAVYVSEEPKPPPAINSRKIKIKSIVKAKRKLERQNRKKGRKNRA